MDRANLTNIFYWLIIVENFVGGLFSNLISGKDQFMNICIKLVFGCMLKSRCVL